MKSHPSQMILALSLIAFGGTAYTTTAAAQTLYGALSNFDIVNDTGHDTHGMEIEIDGVSVSDVVYTFGDPYERYGNPRIVAATASDKCSDGSTNCVFVRYTSAYNANANPKWAATTSPASPPILRTQGHQCWKYGDPTYPNVPCDHFGVSLLRNPTNTIYTWLVEDAVSAGKLVRHSNPNGTPIPVPLPAPVWNINPNGPPPPGVPVVVLPVIAPPPPPLPPMNPPPGYQNKFGEPIWVRIFIKELSNEHAALDDLVPGNNALADPDVEPPEIEWQLLQSPPIGRAGHADTEQEVNAGGEAITKVYEYYRYTGPVNPEDNEVQCDNPMHVSCGPPSMDPDLNPDPNNPTIFGVGDHIGRQNAAANIAPPACASDVSGGIAVKRSGFVYNRGQQLYYQTITLKNITSSPIKSPISLSLDGLSNNVSLYNQSGLTGPTLMSGLTDCLHQSTQSPIINVTSVDPNNLIGSDLAPNASVNVVLKFLNPGNAGIRYSTRLLDGRGLK